MDRYKNNLVTPCTCRLSGNYDSTGYQLCTLPQFCDPSWGRKLVTIERSCSAQDDAGTWMGFAPGEYLYIASTFLSLLQLPEEGKRRVSVSLFEQLCSVFFRYLRGYNLSIF